jgi:hypothetical protein
MSTQTHVRLLTLVLIHKRITTKMVNFATDSADFVSCEG